MRSISAVLRITREQLEARGQLGHYPALSAIGFACSASFLAIALTGPAALRDLLLKGAGVAAACAVLLALGALKVRQETRSNLAQERAIRKAAAETILSILAHNPPLKPLIREHRVVVQDLIRYEKADALRPLLDTPEEG